MLLDLHLIASRPLLVIGLAAAVIVTKTILITGLSRAFGSSWTRSFRLGLLLSQAGEFGFVLFAQATAAQLVAPEAASLFSAVVTLSMVATPFLMRLTDWLERREVRSGGWARRARAVARDQRDRRRLRPVWPDRRPDDAGQEHRRHHHRQEAEHDRDGRGVRIPRSIMATGFGIDLLRTAGAETAKVIAFCNDNEGGEMTRDAVAGSARGLSPGSGDGPRVRPRPPDRARRARPRVCPARAVRKRGGDGQGGAEGERDRRRTRSSGSSANIGCATASGSSGRARPATCSAGLERSFSADRALPEEEVRGPA